MSDVLRLRIENCLTEGGQGTVFKAEDGVVTIKDCAIITRVSYDKLVEAAASSS